jgi:signal peptidase
MDTTSKTKTARNKRIGVFLTIVQVFFIIALVTLAVASFGTRIPILAKLGLNFFAVTSGSMEPTIPTGALLSAGQLPVEQLKEGDIITYRKINSESGQPVVITHRIHKLEKTESTQKVADDQGNTVDKKVVEYAINTKGDANSIPDGYQVLPTEIIGKYSWHIPWLGFVTSYAQSPTGFVLMVVIPAAILILW